MKRMVWIVVMLGMLASTLSVGVRAAVPEIPAKSALLMDAATGTVLYEQNPGEALPPASVTKVMTLLLIMEAIDTGRIHWDDMVTASESAAAKGGSQIYLKVGETMSVRDMVKSIAVSSANDCACAMAEHIAGSEASFVDMMNAKARELGMDGAHFVNCTGLDDDPNAADHKLSALDIALMSRELIVKHPAITEYTTIWMDTVRNGSFGLSNTNKLVRFYNGTTGLKTGFTSTAGYCLSATAKRDGLELIAVVMGCKTSQDRFSACKSLLDYGFANYALIVPELPETAAIPVKLGVCDTVAAIPANTSAILIDKSQKSLVSYHTVLEESVTAPISKGQRLGTLTILAGEQVLSEIPLVAGESVAKLTLGQMFVRVLKQLVMAGE